MVIRPLLLSLVFTIAIHAASQSNDCLEYGFFGAPQRMELVMYDSTHIEDGQWKPAAAAERRLVMVFNAHKNVDTIMTFSLVNDGPEPRWDDLDEEERWIHINTKHHEELTDVDWTLATAKIFFFDEWHQKTGWKLEENGSTTQRAEIGWISRKQYHENVCDASGTLLNANDVFLKRNGNSFRIEERAIHSNGEEERSTVLLKRKSFGPANEVTIINHGQKTKKTTQYEVLERDHNGNPTKTLVHRSDGHWLYVRTYEY